jgi:HEAT repeat protein
MWFREFISNFRYRGRLKAEFERYQSIEPPANPSRRYIDKLVGRLLNEHTAWDARRELDLMGSAAVSSLLAALEDQRFHRAEWEKYSQVPAPLESTLELLVMLARDEVVRIASPMVKSPSNQVRKTVALQLGSAGHATTIPSLQELMRDEDGYVRSHACIGIHRAVTGGRADVEFRRQAYDLLLSQCDQDWGIAMNDAAETIVVLDPERAALDLGDERWLNMSNRNTYRIVEACNRANILLPETIIRRLLSDALSRAVGERCYPNDYVAAAALCALAMWKSGDAGTIADSLLNHQSEKLREAAAEALAALADISDPTGFVIGRVSKEGYEALSQEQRVVYCAFLFDAEVCNGGLMQFFGNSSGDHAVDTLNALAELRHNEAHAALATAIRLVGPLAREPERELRLTGFEGRWDELQPAFDPLESAYYKTNVRLRQAWLLYAIGHADHFRR